MQLTTLFKRTLHLAWSYRATWVLGAALALTTTQGLFMGYVWQRRDIAAHNTLRLSPSLTLNFPGEGLHIDLTDPDAVSIQILKDGLIGLETVLGGIIPQGVRAVLIGGAVLASLLLLTLLTARYVAEAGLIRMVAEAERTGRRARAGQGWRWGWSPAAWRMLLIDLLVTLGVVLALVLALAIALAPLMLWSTRNMLAGALGTALASGLLVIAALAAGALLLSVSIVVPMARRHCVLEGMNVAASLRAALFLVKAQPWNTIAAWLVWAGVRLAWALAVIPLSILLAPLALALLPLGLLSGGLSALAVGSALAIGLHGAVPWIIGAMAGIPWLVLTLSMPWLLVSAPVEVIKSSWWTLAVMELRLLPKRGLHPQAESAPTSTPLPVPILVSPQVAIAPPARVAAASAHGRTAKPTTRRRQQGARPAPKSKAPAKDTSRHAAASKAGARKSRVAQRRATPRRKN